MLRKNLANQTTLNVLVIFSCVVDLILFILDASSVSISGLRVGVEAIAVTISNAIARISVHVGLLLNHGHGNMLIILGIRLSIRLDVAGNLRLRGAGRLGDTTGENFVVCGLAWRLINLRIILLLIGCGLLLFWGTFLCRASRSTWGCLLSRSDWTICTTISSCLSGDGCGKVSI